MPPMNVQDSAHTDPRERPFEDAAREALREILSMALGVAVPANAPIEPQAVVRQVAARLSWRGDPCRE